MSLQFPGHISFPCTLHFILQTPWKQCYQGCLWAVTVPQNQGCLWAVPHPQIWNSRLGLAAILSLNRFDFTGPGADAEQSLTRY